VVEGKSKDQKETKGQDAKTALAPWRPDHYLQSQIEGLRERVITYFEVRNLNHKPKLVALTACDDGAGVSTLAAGLAASLSRTGDGSVLLVDINSGSSFAFYKGNAGCGPSVKMKSDTEHVKILSTDLGLATIKPESDRWERISNILPEDFNDLFPNLNAKEYDYIVFDMAAVSPTSVTPRMAGHMDLVLLILECEKTGQFDARQAATLMRESRANVVAVLNKWRNYVPAGLSHE
jgi:Mrp family chromosome partitioning ATPase